MWVVSSIGLVNFSTYSQRAESAEEGGKYQQQGKGEGPRAVCVVSMVVHFHFFSSPLSFSLLVE
jgi:hypothetical protein